jgi:hypothetical protein
MASILRRFNAMGRERCFFCGRFIFDGDDVTRPASLGLSVHRHCYLRDAGLEDGSAGSHPRTEETEPEDDEEDSGL